DRHKVLDRIIVQVLVYERVGRQRRVGCHQERIAVRRLMMDVKRGQRSVRSRAIFDDDRLAECGAELVGDDARNRVAAAARTEHVDDGNRPRRIIVGISRRTEECSYGGYQNEGKLFHGVIPPWAGANVKLSACRPSASARLWMEHSTASARRTHE